MKLLLLVLLLALPLPLLPGSAWEAKVSPMLLGIRDIESSDGTDCGPSTAGALTCFQILPATALLERCAPAWREEEAVAAVCAQRWLDRGERLCRRWDWYGQGRWYRWGECKPFKARGW